MIMSSFTIFLALVLVWVVGGAKGFASPPDSLRKGWQDLSSSSDSLRKSWQDLAPPFNQQQPKPSEETTMREVKDTKQDDVVHFCFLVHGHRGLSKDLGYLQAVMQSLAQQEKQRIFEQRGSTQDLIVHNAVCNERKTTDGVAMGGQRLFQEMLSIIKRELSCRTTKNVTLSIVGNSLGGIYSRYAIAKLAQSNELPCEIDFNIFCTTASPHLGVSQHTYVPLSRSTESMVAHAMGDTGKDLFRLTDLMKTMATSEEYIAPLGSFRKRIAYANAYGTDFPVPAETAAFLHNQSTYPHHFNVEEPENDDDSCIVVDEGGLVIATLHTPPGHASSCLNEEHEDELVQMSTALDALGWTKRFVDIRKEVPRIAIPRVLTESLQKGMTGSLQKGKKMLSSLSSTDMAGDAAKIQEQQQEKEEQKEEEPNVTASLHELKQNKKIVESRDLAKSVKKDDTDPYHRLQFPAGHNMMVAFSRSRISTYMNKGGRPVVDGLAKELVEGIFAWNADDDKKK